MHANNLHRITLNDNPHHQCKGGGNDIDILTNAGLLK